MTKVKVFYGDICNEQADALLTTTYPSGTLQGQVDRQIRRLAGEHFHDQVVRNPRPTDGTVVFARGEGRTEFANVLFVVDDWSSPLDKLVLAGLRVAEAESLTTVSIPLLRTGAARSVHESTHLEAVAALARGIHAFTDTNPSQVRTILAVAYYGHQELADYLRSLLVQ